MMKSGRVMYGWPQDDGGIPPKLENIKTYQTDQGKIRKFVNELLGKHTELGRDMKNLLVANGMRHNEKCAHYVCRKRTRAQKLLSIRQFSNFDAQTIFLYFFSSTIIMNPSPTS